MKIKHIKGNYRGVEKQIRKAVNQTAIECMKEAMEKAKTSTPEDSGTMRRSIAVSTEQPPNPTEAYTKAEGGNDLITEYIGNSDNTKKLQVFGSVNTPYAATQHETNPTHPKFLEKGFNIAKKDATNKIKQAINDVLKK